ncbi:unnamed protein product [Angiostrongylus costaricensis]|uniref:Secreted protein n=1 Tax=Angiostrongylus costaricensis TaxID=334426 RepID=A0A0R3P9X9_ANGCS|nr:unnamed protein product [Angiostrongylus costaricensis]
MPSTALVAAMAVVVVVLAPLSMFPSSNGCGERRTITPDAHRNRRCQPPQKIILCVEGFEANSDGLGGKRYLQRR